MSDISKGNISVDSPPDVLVIGAGPSGAIASALLVRQGYRVLVLEREQFPRFSIGESLLPHCMQYIEEAGMLEAVQAAAEPEGFQYKEGAAFLRSGQRTDFDFRQKSTEGPGTTFQVRRGAFDKVLADSAADQGVDIRYGHTITAVDVNGERPNVSYTDADGEEQTISAKFLLDASGFGRVLPRLLELETPSDFPVRQSVFTHVVDNIQSDWFDRNKILITVHPTNRDIWYWLIPFADGTCSLGVVAEPELLSRYPEDPKARLQAVVNEEPDLGELLKNAEYNIDTRCITGYSANVSSLHGNNFALLGNAGEFLDPVFSSGVTIAVRSASMAVKVLDKQLKGEAVDWEADYAKPLMKGVETFRTFVTGWYDQSFQDVIFFEDKSPDIKKMVCSILAGYAWDENNPYVADSKRRLRVLSQLCEMQSE